MNGWYVGWIPVLYLNSFESTAVPINVASRNCRFLKVRWDF